MSNSESFYIGQRLSYSSSPCTIRYYGPVASTTGPWLGVEWDDPTRGKHSGSHNNHQYFTCLNPSPTSASFIRPNRKTDEKRTFVQALKSKYASDFDDEDGEGFEDPDVEVLFNVQKGSDGKWVNLSDKKGKGREKREIKFSGKVAEEVGFDKIRKQLAQLSELKIIILDGLCMWRPEARGERWMAGGEKTDVREACPKATELDLSRNLFEEWREVAGICEQLDRLGSLRVDGTRFKDTTLTNAERERCLKAFDGIKTLKLEDNLLPWEDLARLTHLFPTLTTFSASSNLYTTLSSHTLTPTITDLTLEDNLITSLCSLTSLTTLPNLKRLILKSNKISDIITNPTTPFPTFPPTVHEVDLTFNEISTWTFIESLAHVFPGLTSLRVSHNPLYENLQAPDGRTLTADDGYMLTLARLGNLKTLNHSPINEKERLNAESYYLSMIAKEVQFAPERLRAQILASHPRYEWLCEEYGEPDVQRNVNAVNPNSLAARLVRIKFYRVAGGEVFETEIPMSCTAYTVLGIIGKRFGVAPLKCRLVWETGDWMSARKTMGGLDDEEWDSEDSEAEIGMQRIMREVEIVPGTRSIGTWVDGTEAVVRVEVK
ncbi:tubulin-specific chaperone-like protein E [Plenodomus tracheiphilus IPT5]|uniref:Tubulin-specific chaperone-like protein E n=1 Tax=Plenodomus tracheiphilus IPT5 TaxID=1408161 RepID=A0A6A7BMS4_9PLEO|nr:tubulin-specific chaperone-like protein E [Plenodomus tracheiphilus IPT5]